MTAALALDGIDLAYTRRGARVVALEGVSIEVAPGECVGLIGESGSGKSSLAAVAAGLIDADAGEVRLGGDLLPRRAARRDRAARRRLATVFQDPYGSLDPAQTVAAIIAEGPRAHGVPAPERAARVAALLADVGLPPEFARRRPHALSGGQHQRVAIARALAVEPQVVILDEPTSALDVSVQAQILNLLLDLQARHGLAYLFISHDIDVIRHMCTRTYVLQAGRIVEHGPTAIVLRTPAHAYTRRLLAATPVIAFEETP